MKKIVLGILFLLIAEGTLWGLYLYKSKIPSLNSQGKTLCIGDSHTWGVGAKEGESYVDYLNQHYPSEFINLGIPSENSKQLLQRLPTLIKQYRPKRVLLLTGANNHWNNVDSPLTDSFFSKIRLIRFGYKFYKTIELSFSSNERQAEYILRLIQTRKLNQAEELLTKAHLPNKDLLSGLIFRLRKQIPNAIESLSKAKGPQGFLELAYLYKELNQITEAKLVLVNALDKYPQNEKLTEALNSFSHDELDFSSITDEQLEDENLYMNDHYTTNINQWLNRDLSQAIKLLKSAKVEVVLLNYFSPLDPTISVIQDTIALVAQKEKVTFINNQNLLSDIKEYSLYFEPLGGAFGHHPNGQGYKLMADNILEALHD